MENEELFTTNMFVFIAILIVIAFAAQWRIYQKAGKPGWAAIVPIYNVIILMEIIGKPWWWLLLILFPPTSLIFAVWATNLLSKSFGQGVGFTLGLIFLSIIFYPMLAFGNFEYKGPAGNPTVVE